VSPRRKLLVAIVIGVALAGPPVAALNIWLGGLADQQGRGELELTARRHMAIAEGRIGRAVETLNELARRGIDSCGAHDIDALRRATFATTPIKELSITADDGRTLCSDVGQRSEPLEVISSEPLSETGSILLEVVRLDGGPGRWLRIRRPGLGTDNGIAALIPADLFVPQVSTTGEPLRFHARMLTAAGVLIADVGNPERDANGGKPIVVDQRSDRYALDTVISAVHAGIGPNRSDLRAVGIVASGLLAIFILAMPLLLPRRPRDNPIVEIEQALKAGEFVPYYQPIVDIRSGRLRGAEVLVRWHKPDGSVVLPATFIPLVESSGLIIDMTHMLMRRVCREAGAVVGRRPHLKLGFNLTARHFADEHIVDDVREIFRKSPMRLSQVMLEVTERQPIENLTETRRVIAALQGIGVKVAIDDVGIGHSGLSYMLKLGVDVIKIDKMFIDSLGTDRNSNAIIETLIDLAQNMRMDVVAEGVESFEQVVHLRDLGIRAAQGYVFAPPLPGSAFLQLVETIDPLKESESETADEPMKLSRFGAA
jgi:sensor c-di-GMP phosphodiesterase-like protein